MRQPQPKTQGQQRELRGDGCNGLNAWSKRVFFVFCFVFVFCCFCWVFCLVFFFGFFFFFWGGGNFQFKFHTRITYDTIYIIHNSSYLLLFVKVILYGLITPIRFSVHSHGRFTSDHDCASVQEWLLHLILNHCLIIVKVCPGAILLANFTSHHQKSREISLNLKQKLK